MFTNEIIDKNTPIPMYYQLKQIILDDIHNGMLKPGDMIPAEMEITKKMGLSRTTVRQAIMELVNEGHLHRIKGKGTFIAQGKIEQEFMTRIESFNDEMLRKGYEPKTELLEQRILPANTDVAKNLNVEPGELVLKIKRLRFANKDPIVIVDTYLVAKHCSHIYDYDLSKYSLYELMSKDENTRVVKIQRSVEASVAGQYESETLCIDKGFPLQIFRSIGFNHDNTPMEYSIATYRGDKSKFKVTITI